MKKTLVTLLVLLIGFGTAGYFYLSGQKYVVTIQENKLQQQFDQKMPITKTYLYLFDVTLFNPRIDLVKETGRVVAGIDIHVKTKLKGVKPVNGSVNASGVLKYEPREGAFYLKSAKLERFVLRDMPDNYLEQTKKFVEKTLKNYLEANPVYKLKSDDLGQYAASMMMKDVKVNDTEIVVRFGL